jgi:hypothetical protein
VIDLGTPDLKRASDEQVMSWISKQPEGAWFVAHWGGAANRTRWWALFCIPEVCVTQGVITATGMASANYVGGEPHLDTPPNGKKRPPWSTGSNSTDIYILKEPLVSQVHMLFVHGQGEKVVELLGLWPDRAKRQGA